MTGVEHCYLVEWYQRVPVGDDADDVSRRLTAAATHTAAEVVLVLSLPADETVFCVVRADAADAVTALCREVGWPADRVTPDVSTHVS